MYARLSGHPGLWEAMIFRSVGIFRGTPRYGQSRYEDSGFRRVGLKQNLDLKGWTPEIPSRRISAGTVLVGRLGEGQCDPRAAGLLPPPPTEAGGGRREGDARGEGEAGLLLLLLVLFLVLLLLLLLLPPTQTFREIRPINYEHYHWTCRVDRQLRIPLFTAASGSGRPGGRV